MSTYHLDNTRSAEWGVQLLLKASVDLHHLTVSTSFSYWPLLLYFILSIRHPPSYHPLNSDNLERLQPYVKGQ